MQGIVSSLAPQIAIILFLNKANCYTKLYIVRKLDATHLFMVYKSILAFQNFVFAIIVAFFIK